MVTLQNQINNLKKTVGEKDLKLSQFEAKQIEIEKRMIEAKSDTVKDKTDFFEIMTKKVEEKNKTLVEKIDILEAKVKREDKTSFKCSQCDFEASSKRGLQSHVGRKHKTENRKYPTICDLCESELKNEKELKKHMLTHSYNNIQFKCDECEFYGSDDLAMEIHFRNTHNEIVECGLCDSTFKDAATIDVQILTCEGVTINVN